MKIALFGSAGNGKTTYLKKTIQNQSEDYYSIPEYIDRFVKEGGVVNESASKEDKESLKSFVLTYINDHIASYEEDHGSKTLISDRSFFDLIIFQTIPFDLESVDRWINGHEAILVKYAHFFDKIIFFDRLFIDKMDNNPNRSRNNAWLKEKYFHAKICFERLNEKIFKNLIEVEVKK